MHRLLVLLLLLLLPAALRAEEAAVRLRVGNHPAHGRVVFDWPARTAFQVEQGEDRLVLRFARPAAFDLAAARHPPRNVRSVTAEGGAVTIAIAPGSRGRVFRLGNRVVVDVQDAAPPTPAAAAPPPRAAAPRQAATPPARSAAPAATTPAVATPPPAEAAPAPRPEADRPAAPEPMLSLHIPADAEVGAALFRRGDAWLVVLDAALPLDPARLHPAELATFPDSTVLRLPVSALADPRLSRTESGWTLAAAGNGPAPEAIRAEMDPGPPARLILRATQPSRSVPVLDPETGGTLLVGTLREAGEAMPFGRRAATFEILPTRLGAVLLPHADTVTLRALPGGFVASPGPGADLALGAAPSEEADAEPVTRLFDLPAEPLAALIQRERNAALAVHAAPPLGRGPPRLADAEALLALGMGVEAQSMVALALREDPHLARDPKAKALHGAAALLAGRAGEADGLRDARLPESDELTLWRGLLAVARGEDGTAQIAAGLNVLRAWPEPLRERLGPMAAEALAAGGEIAAARRALAGQEANPAYALARARLLEAEGQADQAIAAYAEVARGRDRRARAEAMRRDVELRLAAGRLDKARAAAAMEAVLAAWRGDAREREARLRLAELRSEAGDHRGAFDALREAGEAFPEIAQQIRPRLAEALVAAIATQPPIEAVALFDTHAALLPPGPRTEQALASLADRLAALDLVDRARTVLAQGLARVGTAESRARLGLRLAALALGAGDAAGAKAALERTAAAALPEPLEKERLVMLARSLARLGDVPQAVERYRAAGPEAAAELAELLAARQDWAGAAAAMRTHLTVALPPTPAPLEEPQRRLVARAAALLALAGDNEGLAALRAAEGPRMEGGAFSDSFTLMTADRISGVGDLPRLRRELELARLLPSRLESLRPGAGSGR